MNIELVRTLFAAQGLIIFLAALWSYLEFRQDKASLQREGVKNGRLDLVNRSLYFGLLDVFKGLSLMAIGFSVFVQPTPQVQEINTLLYMSGVTFTAMRILGTRIARRHLVRMFREEIRKET